jgi:hypothetical protein
MPTWHMINEIFLSKKRLFLGEYTMVPHEVKSQGNYVIVYFKIHLIEKSYTWRFIAFHY